MYEFFSSKPTRPLLGTTRTIPVVYWRDDPARTKKEGKPLELGLVLGHRLSVKSLKRVLIRAFVVEPCFPHRGDNDLVARQVYRIPVSLIDGPQLPPGMGPVE